MMSSSFWLARAEGDDSGEIKSSFERTLLLSEIPVLGHASSRSRAEVTGKACQAFFKRFYLREGGAQGLSMPNTDKSVLVTGATGRQGGAVIRHMLPKGWRLRALTRNPASHTAKEIARQGVEVVQGDLENPGSLEAVCRGIYGVYSVQDFWSVGARREIQQGKNLADAAKKAGVQHFVYSSAGGAE